MSDHYFSHVPNSKREDRQFEAVIRGKHFRFQTDSGVFSKKGLDFGSRLLIETVDIPSKRPLRILDLGCGYGPIGISMAKTYSTAKVSMIDINERAVELAKQNAARNGVIDQVEVFVSDGFEAMGNRKFDAILFNPPIRTGKSVIYRLFAEAKDYLTENGFLWIVIRKQQGAESARTELLRLFTNVEVVAQKKGYWIIQAGF